jgi:hypothetical protein
MSGPARILAFAALLVLVFVTTALAGGAIDPSGPDGAAKGRSSEAHGAKMTEHDSPHGGHGTATAPRGLASAEDGYRLSVADTELPRGRAAELRFRIVDAEGAPVRDFALEHERRMHLILVRRDLTGYQHVHPTIAPDGTWAVSVTLPEGGSYRAFADFNTNGRDLTLGADLTAAGEFRPQPLPHSEATARADGYEVEKTGKTGDVDFTVRRDGREVTDLEPYLGARGHLVALREGDLAFLHVHPEDAATKGAGISFHTEYPSEGRYRLFLQFKHDGRVHTVAFTEEVGDEHGH